MCIFSDYFYACNHPAIRHPFCSNPCPRYISFADHVFSDAEGEHCPDHRTREIFLPFACEDCSQFADPASTTAASAAPVRTEGTIWHIPEAAALVQHLRTTDPWAEDSRRQRKLRHVSRSVSPKDKSRSGVRIDGSTELRSGGRNAVCEVRALLQDLRADLSEKEIAKLVIEHPRMNPRRPSHVPQPALGRK